MRVASDTESEAKGESVDIGPLYHWSPRSRLQGITRYGLVPSKRPSVGTIPAVTGGVPMVCYGISPADAWALSGDMAWATGLGPWDLWQVRLFAADEIHVLPNFGPRIREVRVANRIPKSRLTWIGERP